MMQEHVKKEHGAAEQGQARKLMTRVKLDFAGQLIYYAISSRHNLTIIRLQDYKLSNQERSTLYCLPCSDSLLVRDTYNVLH